jgi:hypothetical protein
MVGRYMSAYEKKSLTQGPHFQTHRGSTAERSAEGPVVDVTGMKNRTRLLSVAAVQCLSCKIGTVSVGCRSGENGGEEKV